MTLKVWNGSSWVSATGAKVWNGSSWVSATGAKVWNGSSWVEFLGYNAVVTVGYTTWSFDPGGKGSSTTVYWDYGYNNSSYVNILEGSIGSISGDFGSVPVYAAQYIISSYSGSANTYSIQLAVDGDQTTAWNGKTFKVGSYVYTAASGVYYTPTEGYGSANGYTSFVWDTNSTNPFGTSVGATVPITLI